MLQIGSVLDGKYKILNEIGHGGMSVVYLALNERANKTWAVKEVKKDGGKDSEVLSQGLVAETEMLKKLNHPNLPSIIDVIDREDTFIIVMDYIEGRSLQSVLNHGGAQDPEKVLDWSKQLCDVLGYLHSRKPAIIYRDMKPANVMLKPNGQIALIDFGTAREYKEHSQGDTTWLGTRGYAAPEQFGGRGQTDARTDIYCLGATMYHLLTGYSPADTQFVIRPLSELKPEFAGSGFEQVVAKCCAPDPADRYQNCAELMYALDHIHDQDAVAIKERNRKWHIFMAGCSIALIGMIGMAGFSITKSVTKNQSYDHYLEAARLKSSYEEKAVEYRKAIELKPEDESAYIELHKLALDPGTEKDVKIGPEEVQTMKDVIDPVIKGSKQNPITLLKDRNHKGYLEFQYKRAMDYYLLGESISKKEAKNVLDSIKDDKELKEKQGLCECLAQLCELKVMDSSKETSGDTSISEDESETTAELFEDKGKYKEAWRNLVKIAGEPQSIDNITGDMRYSGLIYQEIADQIINHSTEYKEDGVTNGEIMNLLETASSYISSRTPNDEKTRKIFRRAEDSIEDAKLIIEESNKHNASSDGSSKSSDKDDEEESNNQ